MSDDCFPYYVKLPFIKRPFHVKTIKLVHKIPTHTGTRQLLAKFAFVGAFLTFG